jgi:hypothetical protein
MSILGFEAVLVTGAIKLYVFYWCLLLMYYTGFSVGYYQMESYHFCSGGWRFLFFTGFCPSSDVTRKKAAMEDNDDATINAQKGNFL